MNEVYGVDEFDKIMGLRVDRIDGVDRIDRVDEVYGVDMV